MLQETVEIARRRARKKRAELLHSIFCVSPSWSVLDLGGGNGDHASVVFPRHENITVSDYSEADLLGAEVKHGYKTVLADGTNGALPFGDNQFDLVFCNSVIEHVTGPKDQAIGTRNGRLFRKSAWAHQSSFAQEIARVGKRYFVQTPHPLFLIESHSWLPLPFALLPREAQIPMLKMSGAILPKKTRPDWHLLMPSDMAALFPDSSIHIERFAGLPKSIIAAHDRVGQAV